MADPKCLVCGASMPDGPDSGVHSEECHEARKGRPAGSGRPARTLEEWGPGDETPPPAEAVERLEGVLMVFGHGFAAVKDPILSAGMSELTCVMRALLTLGRRHADELHELYLVDRRQPMPLGLTPPALVRKS